MGCCNGSAKPSARGAADDEPITSQPEGEASIYDLCEDDQLSLAIQRSLEDGDCDPARHLDVSGGLATVEGIAPTPHQALGRTGPAAADVAPAGVLRPRSSSSTSAPANVGRTAGSGGSAHDGAGPEWAGGSAATSPRVATPEVTGQRGGHPEWAGSSAAEDAAGPVRYQPPADGRDGGAWASVVDDAVTAGPLAGRSLDGVPVSYRTSSNRGAPEEAAGGGGRSLRVPAPAPPAPPKLQQNRQQKSPSRTPPSALPLAVDVEVKRALELAKAKRFSEADKCLSRISSSYPEHRDAREVVAAQEAVAMCKQFHNNL